MKTGEIEHMRAFNRFYTGIIGLLNRHILDSEFSLPEARVLFEICHCERATASDIQVMLHMDRGYLSRLLVQFEKKGLITRTRSSEDGRAYFLSLTAKGRKAFAQLDYASQQQVKDILQPIPPQQRDELITHMNAIRRILTPS